MERRRPGVAKSETPAGDEVWPGLRKGLSMDEAKGYVWGPINAEDLAPVPASPWLITSGMTGISAAHGRLYAVDRRDYSCNEIFPYLGSSAPDEARFGKQAPWIPCSSSLMASTSPPGLTALTSSTSSITAGGSRSRCSKSSWAASGQYSAGSERLSYPDPPSATMSPP